MIKNLLTAGLLLGSLITAKAQELNTMPRTNVNFDSNPMNYNMGLQKSAATQTVGLFAWYFYDKHDLNTTPDPTQFWVWKSPKTATDNKTEFGVSFLNPNTETVIIASALVMTGVKSNSAQGAATNSSIPLTVTIYSADALGVPGSSIATATAAATGTSGIGFSQAVFGTPVLVGSSFFISVKAAPTSSLDTVWIGHNNGNVASSTVTANNKFSDTLCYVKVGANWQQHLYTGGFAPETVIIPEVYYSYSTATPSVSAPTSTSTPGAYCTGSAITYTNKTVGLVMNKQFNYNAFAARWKPYQYTTYTYTPVSDPLINWTFGGAPTPTATYTTNIASHTYSAVTGGTSAAVTHIIKQQTFRVNGNVKTQDLKTMNVNVVSCSTAGLEENSAYASISIYPNPAINGKTMITGLNGINTITVYNLIGQVISKETSEKENVTVDLSNQISGTYIVKLSNQYGDSKVTKVIKD